MNRPRGNDSAALMATLGAAIMMAHQVAAKATRDTLFLSGFRPDTLPVLIFFAAVFSIGLVMLASRAMVAKEPATVVPAAFGISAALHLAEWSLSLRFPKAVAVVFYLHLAALSAVLISAFWSLVNESFDPHEARQRMSRIAGGAAFGALAGGAIAVVIGAWQMAAAMLPILAVMHLGCAVVLRKLSPVAVSRSGTGPDPAWLSAGARLLRAHTYLRHLAMLVLLGSIGSVLIHLVFMNRAAYKSPQQLLTFFAMFGVCANIVNCLIQMVLTRLLLEKNGLGATAALHPATIALGSLGGILAPGIESAVLAKGSEQVVHNSLFRSAYELFYTPLPPEEKRRAKPLIDVGFERLGDMAGAVVGRGLGQLGSDLANPATLAAAAGAGLAGIWIARRLDRGYIAELERSLKDRALDLKLEDVTDHTTRVTLIRTRSRLAVPALPEDASRRAEVPPAPGNPLQRRIAELRCGDARRVRRALDENEIGPELAPYAIVLLGWDEVAEEAMRALRRAGPAITGQLVDALRDEATDFAVRRRLPRVLAGLPSARAFNGLAAALADKRFEVRYRCGRALQAMQGLDGGLALPEEAVYRAVCRELEVDRNLWESRKLLDGGEEDQLVGDQANRGLEHVFTLLSMALPKEPLRISFCALHTRDEMLRGTALEYLDSVLPPNVRERLWPFLEDGHTANPPGRSHDQVLAALMESHASVQEKLLALRAKKRTAG